MVNWRGKGNKNNICLLKIKVKGFKSNYYFGEVGSRTSSLRYDKKSKKLIAFCVIVIVEEQPTAGQALN